MMFQPITIKIAGMSFNDCQKNIRQWGCADIGTYAVIREPDNPYDKNAVRVSLFGIHEMGYLPSSVARKVAPLMDTGRTFLAEFICRNEYGSYQNIGLTVRIVETE